MLFSFPAAAVETLSVADIRPGMEGEGRTVFSGDRLDSFKVHILGVLRHFGPQQNLILARLEGGPLAETGVIAGMSGSPVYVNGKLIGAVAYSFPFSKEPIAGITPIEEMIAATASAPERKRVGALPFPPTPEKLAAAATRDTGGVTIRGTHLVQAADGLAPYLGRVLTPIATPASLTGFSRESLEIVGPLLRSVGLEPALGGAVATRPQESGASTPAARPESRPVHPGDAIGVGLISGDLEISATGTVTYVDPATGDVYAFGHPMFNLGPIEYPMTRATVHVVIPNLLSSFKLASSGETVGTWLQDRITAIRGILGTKPNLIPLGVTVKTSRGDEKKYQLQLVNDELFSPVLTFVSLVSIIQTTERQFGAQTVRVSSWINIAGERRVNIDDVFADENPAIAASAMVAAPLSFLMNNDFRAVQIKDLQVTLDATEVPQTSALVRAWVDDERATPGARLTLKLLLRSYRGEDTLKTVAVEIPKSVSPGRLQLVVADAQTMTSLEQREIGERFVPRDLDQLIRAINNLRKNNRLYVRLLRSDRGAIVRGEYLSSLPPSVLNVLDADRSSGQYIPTRIASLWEDEVVLDASVRGSRTLEIEVRAR
jgi:hypothetical protein